MALATASGIQRVAKRRRAPSQTVAIHASISALRAVQRPTLNSGSMAIVGTSLRSRPR
jgi:hypothetical protein